MRIMRSVRGGVAAGGLCCWARIAGPSVSVAIVATVSQIALFRDRLGGRASVVGSWAESAIEWVSRASCCFGRGSAEIAGQWAVASVGHGWNRW